jgi:hypothetical protein
MLGYALTVYVKVSINWDFTLILSIGVWGMVSVQTALQLYLAIRYDRIRHQKRKRAFKQSISSSTLNAGHFNLNVILNDKVLAKAFEDHLQKEFGVESLFFYQEVKAWKITFRDMSPSTRASRARKIIKTFIQPDGIFCVNIPSSISKIIMDESQIAAARQDPDFPPQDLFDDAVEEVKELLELGALARFKNSQTFKNLIQEGLQHLEPAQF